MKDSFILAFLVLYPFLGALISCGIGRKNEKARDYFADFIGISEFLLMLLLFFRYQSQAEESAVLFCTVAEICGLGLHFTLDGFRLIYGMIAALMWMMTTILSAEYFEHHKNRNRFYMFLLMTLGATMGVFLSEDLYTTFIFFEIMSFTSYVWVVQEENKDALHAADVYLAVAVIGGMVMLMGLFMISNTLGTLRISELLPAAAACEEKGILYAAGVCMLVGFGAKAGVYPLHIWLPKAHPAAPAPASALLSGILTKTGVFGILVVSCNLFLYDQTWGKLILGIGVATMFTGALLAVFSIDLKRTLACSSVSQIGFIMVGIGMQGLLGEENALAVRGTFLHMVNHSMIKLVLFMAAGVIFMNTHALDLNQIRGFGRRKPLLKGIFLIGALAIGGIPMFGGYVSKTLLHESIVEFGGTNVIRAVEYIFLFSGGLTVAYMTKLFAAIFVECNSDEKVQKKYDEMKIYMNRQSTFALGGSALILLIWGLFPYVTMNAAADLGQTFMHLEGEVHAVHYFSAANLTGGFISILLGAVVYVFVIRTFLMKKTSAVTTMTSKVYVDIWPAWLDLVKLYNALVKAVSFAGLFICRITDTIVDGCVVMLRKSIYRDKPLPHERAEGNLLIDIVGGIMNLIQKIHNWLHKKDEHCDYVHILTLKAEELKLSTRVIERSLSFGLLLFGIGFCLMLLYLLQY